MIYIVVSLVVLLVIVSRVTYRSGYENGITVATHKHQHIWGPWERGIQDNYDNHGRKIAQITIQGRNCDDCNYAEVEELSA